MAHTLCAVLAAAAVSWQALLLQMVGGVSQEFPGTGMKLRGDIHVCLMGDPGECGVTSTPLGHIDVLVPHSVSVLGLTGYPFEWSVTH